MPRKKARIEPDPSPSRINNVSLDQFELNEIEDHVDMIFIPNVNDSGDSGDESDAENVDSDEVESSFFNECFRQMSKEYTISQIKLENNHEYI